MVSNKQHRYIPILYFYLVIFHAMFFQGAYYISGLITLNLAFLFYLLLSKKYAPLNIPLLGFLFLFFIALLSNLFLSINPYIGINELVKYSLFPLSYFIFYSYEDKEALGKIFYRSFIMLMGFGLLAWLGFRIMPGMVTIQSNRLQSLLQYANTTALFMGIGLLLSIDKYQHFKRKYYLLLASLFAVALFLTQSRTTFVLFVFIVILYLFIFLKKKGRLVLISGLFLSFAIMAFSGARIAKIALTEPTLIERLISFSDGIRILIQKPLGLGLGNWQYMQFQYQSAPYQVRYIHNFYLQVALDAGILAAILFIGLMFLYFLKNIRSKSVHFFIFLLILLQSFFEISLNYGIVILYFTYVLTLLKQPDYSFGNALHKGRLPEKLKYLLVIPMVLLAVIFVSESYVTQGNRYRQLSSYKKAQEINPFHSGLYFKRAQLEDSSKKALDLLERGYEQNPYDFQLILSLVEGYLYGEEIDKAYFYADQLLSIFPYHKAHQQLNYKVLERGYELEHFSVEDYEKRKAQLDDRILTYNEGMNPFYRYINAEMDY